MSGSPAKSVSPELGDLTGEVQSTLGQFGWTRFIALAIVFYLAFLFVWWYALDAITFLTGNIAAWLYGMFDSSVQMSTHEKLIIFSVKAGQNTAFAGQARTTALNMGRITY